MTALQRRVLKLETRLGMAVPAPWELPGWEALSEAAQLGAVEDYVAAHPHSRVAKLLRALPTMTDDELETLQAECEQALAEAQAVGTPPASRP